MSGWTDFAGLAKTALFTAQKRIDKVLDITDAADEERVSAAPINFTEGLDAHVATETSQSEGGDVISVTAKQLQDDFFAAFGLGGKKQVHQEEPNKCEGEEEEEAASLSGNTFSSAFAASPKLNLSSLFSEADDTSHSKSQRSEVGWSSWVGGAAQEPSVKDEHVAAVPVIPSETNVPSLQTDSSETDPIRVSHHRESYEEVDLVAASNAAEDIPAENYQSAVLSFVEDSISEDMAVSELSVPEDESESPSEVVSGGSPQLQDSISQSDSLTASSATLGRPDSSGAVSQGTEEDSSEQSQCTTVELQRSQHPSESDLNKQENNLMDTQVHLSLADELAEADGPPEPEAAVKTCVESVLKNVSEKLSPRESLSDPISVIVPTDDDDNSKEEEAVTPEGDRGSEESSGGAGHSIADSFVHLEPSEGSPPLSTHKSETSSVVKGSGYTSPTDELETAASSDIEVISTNNGDTWSERSSRSGVVVSVPAGWNQAPSRFRESLESKKTHRRCGSDHGLGNSGNGVPLAMGISSDKIKQLTEALEAREKKVLELSRDTVQLSDENQSLRRQLTQIQQEKVGTEKALSNLQDKFTVASEERDQLRRKYERIEREQQNTGIGIPQLQRLLREKEEQIDDLVKEGDKLSKRELKHTSIIKKLRGKEKETEKLMESQKQRLVEMDSLKQKLRDKETQEIKYDEVMHQMKSTIEKQEKRIQRLQTELDEANEKARSLKTTLDNAYKQISEITREKVAKEAEIHHLQSEADASREQQLHEKLQTLEKEKSSERQDLSRQIEELQLNLLQSSAESDRREQSLKWEIAQLHRKLQEAENRNHELSESVASATKPLLRQIESLQSSFSTQQGNWERVEKALYDRITDSEQKALIAADKERNASAAALEGRAQLGQVEVQLSAVKREKKKLEDQLSIAKREQDRIEEMKKKFQSDLELEKSMSKRAIEDLQRDKEMLSAQFQYEKTQSKLELEERITGLIRQVDEREQMITVLRSQLIEQQMNPQGGRGSPGLGRPTGFVQDFRRSVSPTSTITSFLEETAEDLWAGSTDGTGFSSLLEKMRVKLQQRDGELAVLREEVRHLQQSRDSVTDELVNVGNSQQAMEQRLSQFESLRDKYKELDQRYQALLQMYGEKIEENEELRLDLQDVKTMYKQQIEDLLNEK